MAGIFLMAVIQDEEIHFGAGMNVLTGETGAGKSLLLGSVNLVLGARADKSVIRQGAEYALVEMTFKTDRKDILDKLKEEDLYPDDGTFTLARKITEGRSNARINGETVSASTLSYAAGLLLDIYGQQDSQILLKRKKHLELLDDYGGKAQKERKEIVRQERARYRELSRELEESGMDEDARKRRLKLIRYEIEEIETAGIKKGEDDELEELYQKLLHGRLLGIQGNFLKQLAETVIEGSKDGYPELEEHKEFIFEVIEQEEENFDRTIDQGLKILADLEEDMKNKGVTRLSGEDAFRLYDTFGFPLDLTLDILSEKGYDVDEEGFHKEMEIQRQKARDARSETNYMSEFLLMAATLLDIKSKMLLPAEKNEEGEEEDPRAELVNQLLEYKLYKRAAEELREREEETGQAFCKKPTIPREVAAYAPEIDTDALLKDVTLSGLYKVFQDITRRSVEKIDPIRSRFGKIEKEEVNLAERIEYVRQYAKERGHFSFRQLLEENCGKTRIIVTFLAILELMKRGELRISQEKTFAEIEIEAA